MCKQAKCAFRKNDGYCLMHKASCDILNPEGRCHDGAARAIPHKERGLWQVKAKYDLGTVAGRFQFHTRNARGVQVYSQCTKKVRYENEYKAREVAIGRMRNGSVGLRVYYCTLCEGFHLTSKIYCEPRSGADCDFNLSA